MTPKQEAALRLAREALEYIYEGANNQGPHTGISWRCASNKVEPVIAAIDEALADNALDKMAENARALGLDYGPIVERVENSVGMGHKAWDMVKPKELAKAFHEALAEQPAQQEPVSLEDSLKESKVCCGDYANCHRACTPRGRWEALRLVETAQPSKPWIGLTNQELIDLTSAHSGAALYCTIEAKLKEKNHG